MIEMEIKDLTTEQLERAAAILRAMAHPSRLSIMKLLEEGQALTVSQIQEGVGIEQSAVSHHLGILRDKGILQSRRDGRFIRYFLKYDHLGMILRCVGECSVREQSQGGS
jgi:DNA-binding transcriptional ArsR family regulator